MIKNPRHGLAVLALAALSNAALGDTYQDTPSADDDSSPSLQQLLHMIQELQRKDAEKEAHIARLKGEIERLKNQQGPTPPVLEPRHHKTFAATAHPNPQAPSGTMAMKSPPILPKDATATAPALEAPGLRPYPLPIPGNRQKGSDNAFNPAISVIVDGVYYNDSVSGEGLEYVQEALGIYNVHSHEDEDGHSHGSDLNRGFNMRETEITFSASVDKYFDVRAILAGGNDGLEIEEAYGVTRSLPAGLQVKFGKFYSDIGYINKQHPHQWDFVDQALPYQMLFGGALNETGVQVSWVPELPFYLNLGIEALQGDNQGVTAYVGPTEWEPSSINGEEQELVDVPFDDQKSGPRLYTAYLKAAPDLGHSHALQGGLFGGISRQHQEMHTYHPGINAADHGLQGDAWFAGADLVYKYDAPKPHGQGDFKLQAEYLFQQKDLNLIYHQLKPELVGQPRKLSLDGLYAQALYGFAPRWTAAIRYGITGMTHKADRSASTLGPTNTSEFDDLQRLSAALAWDLTEFSRLRLQYNRVNATVAEDGQPVRKDFDQWFLQYQLSIGVHGAHSF